LQSWVTLVITLLCHGCPVQAIVAAFGFDERVIFASSNHVTGAYEGIPPSLHSQVSPLLITTQHPIRPDGYYGVSKVFGEAIARMYYELHGLESVCLRIGWVLKDDDPTKNEQARRTWLSHRDLVQLWGLEQ
jgi:uronate dehydrogenase